MIRRPYQLAASADVVAFLKSAKHGDSRLYVAPTGTGKSLMELDAHVQLPSNVLITPRVEIVCGLLDKLGQQQATVTKSRTHAETLGIYTPIRLRNLLSAGDIPLPKSVIIDEAHHDPAESYQQIYSYLNRVPKVGFTASPFRGTPKGTVEFLQQWGDEYTQILTYREAVESKWIAWPTFAIVPLVDDDCIEVRGGEIQATAAGVAVMSRLDAICEMLSQWRVAGGGWDRPTMIAVPSTECALAFASHVPDAVAVTQETSDSDRQRAFADCINSRKLLIHINVVSEGIDLPIRRLIDASPTLSPVRWLQQLGRIMRPLRSDETQSPEYVCTNRNLSRHAYLADGLIPSTKVGEAQVAFGGPSSRDGNRVVGLEGIGRFKAAELPLKDGAIGIMYNLESFDGNTKTEYCVLCHPCSSTPIVAEKQSVKNPDDTYTRGKWRAIPSLPDVTGFASAGNDTMTEKQKAWWEKDASRFGLDATAKVTKKNFQALPVLCDLRKKLVSGN